MALENLSLKRKLALIPLAVTAIFSCVLVAGAFVQLSEERMFAVIREQDLPVVEACRDLEESLEAFQRALQDGVAAEDADAIEGAKAHADTFKRRIDEALRRSPGDHELVELSRGFARYQEHALGSSTRLLKAADPALLFPEMKQLARQHRAIRDAVRGVTTHRSEAMRRSFEDATALQRRSTLLVAALMLVGLAALALVVFLIGRDVVTRLDRLTRSASRIATQGDLTQSIDVSARDEIGDLGRSFAAMMEKLRAVPLALRATVTELREASSALHACTQQQLAALDEQERNMTSVVAASSAALLSGHEAFGTARAALQTSTGTVRAAEAGTDALKANFQALSALQAQAQASIETVTAFAERIDSAESVAGVIRELSTKATNLAVEVAVEATRHRDAGELPNVAKQMRQVAARTSKELTLMRDITAEMGRAARVMTLRLHESRRSTEGGLERGRAVETYVKEVGERIEKSNVATRAVLQNVEAQRGSLQSLNASIAELRDHVRAGANGVRTTRSSAATVRATADRIGQIVDGFKV